MCDEVHNILELPVPEEEEEVKEVGGVGGSRHEEGSGGESEEEDDDDDDDDDEGLDEEEEVEGSAGDEPGDEEEEAHGSSRKRKRGIRPRRRASRRSDQGLLGLENLGNTCFVNAAVQCLHRLMSHGMSLGDESATDEVTDPQAQLVKEFADLFTLLNQGGTFSPSSVSPSKFVLAFAKVRPDFFVRPGRGVLPVKQMDMQEVLMAFVCLLHDVLGGSIITDMYEGMEQDLLTCKLCKEHNTAYKPYTVAPAPFICLSLPVPRMEVTTLSACFGEYTTDREQMWTCPQEKCAGGGVKPRRTSVIPCFWCCRICSLSTSSALK
jgi:uncharacterized UBP type Zn finger protein